MKRTIAVLMIIMLAFAFSACGEAAADSQDNPEDIQKELDQINADAEAMESNLNYEWPAEADILGVPELKAGTIEGLGITDKAVAIGYRDLTRDDMEAYFELLKSEGFVDGIEYPGGGMWNYVKNESDGAIDVTIAYGGDDGKASIIINPKEGQLVVPSQSSGELKWLDSIPKEVPVFSKGTIIKADDNYSIFTMEYKDVKQSDAEAYKTALIDAGFELDEEDSSEFSSQFEKMDKAKMSIIIIGVEFEDGYLTVTIAAA